MKIDILANMTVVAIWVFSNEKKIIWTHFIISLLLTVILPLDQFQIIFLSIF